MKILIIDNYDSFTFNLYQYVGEILEEESTRHPGLSKMTKKDNFLIDVFRNDKITVQQIKEKQYDRIIISPGPGDPSNKKYFGVCADVLLKLGKTIPVLGVCLGMQGIAYYFGGKVMKAKKPMHGKISSIQHDRKGIFKNIPQNIDVMRYHSLVADSKTIPNCLEVSAIVNSVPQLSVFSSSVTDKPKTGKLNSEDRQLKTDNRETEIEIMGLRHKKYPIEGIQFHPESFATDAGKIMLKNFLFI